MTDIYIYICVILYVRIPHALYIRAWLLYGQAVRTAPRPLRIVRNYYKLNCIYINVIFTWGRRHMSVIKGRPNRNRNNNNFFGIDINHDELAAKQN